MSREEVTDYAKRCGMSEESEVTKFLDIFRDCASIISSAEKNDFLYKYVILLPMDFIRDLDRLFSVTTNESIPSELRNPTQFGIVSKDLVYSLWEGSYDSSISYSDLYVQVLRNVGLLLALGDKYFVPALRIQHNLALVKSSSLVILSDISLAPFSVKQCQFVKYLTGQYKEAITLNEECVYYNSVGFFWKTFKEKAEIAIHFSQDYIEVSVNSSSKNLSNLYSILKTDCVAIMNMISTKKAYKFCVLCPYSEKSQHFIPFDILETSVGELMCPGCHGIVSSKVELEWVKAAYQGSQRSVIREDDVINPTNLNQLCSNQLSTLSIQEIIALHKKLNSGEKTDINFSSRTHSELLFQVLYDWQRRNPSATRRHLAQLMLECGLHMQGITLDPSLLFKIPSETELPTDFTDNEVDHIASSWTYGVKELAKVLEVDSEIHQYTQSGTTDQELCFKVLKKWLEMTDGDRRDKLADKFEYEGYPSISDVILSLPA